MKTLSFAPILLCILAAPAGPPGAGFQSVIFLGLILSVVFVMLYRRYKRQKKAHAEVTQEAERMIYRVSNTKLKTKFKLSGWDHLDDEASEIQRKVQVGEKLELVADHDNKYDLLAIRVLKGNTQIGWFSRKSKKQKEVFILVSEGKEVDVEVIDTFPIKIKFSYMPKV